MKIPKGATHIARSTQSPVVWYYKKVGGLYHGNLYNHDGRWDDYGDPIDSFSYRPVPIDLEELMDSYLESV